ncbi:hypothetical protein PVAP13_3KG068954 [Panicum virgatum]|uniref:Uncharacterized protein n=1 Tax=Panicum virgatum TaxID=38727 RepID=A0A8T0UMP0_PANVG|nr:hypothetical protein PVAP13_3KG068954 [Panicum virgatum]
MGSAAHKSLKGYILIWPMSRAEPASEAVTPHTPSSAGHNGRSFAHLSLSFVKESRQQLHDQKPKLLASLSPAQHNLFFRRVIFPCSPGNLIPITSTIQQDDRIGCKLRSSHAWSLMSELAPGVCHGWLTRSTSVFAAAIQRACRCWCSAGPPFLRGNELGGGGGGGVNGWTGGERGLTGRPRMWLL